MKYSVQKDEEGQRLDVYLAAKTNTTRSAVQKMITGGQVFVNGTVPKKTGYKICTSDEIVVKAPNTPSYELPGTSYQLHVVAQTPDYVVIDKPAGLVVHASSRGEHVTLVDMLLRAYPEIRGVGDLPTGQAGDPLRPGIVHRLDKDASGVMVIARNQESFDSLKRQFKLRRVSKEYLILVYGAVTPAEGTIAIPISRSAQHSTKFVGSMRGGRDAITNYAVERELDGFSLVRVKPETGRTHQIRVHFYSRGYPLVGDKVYQSSRIRREHTTRLMLHAASLEFRDLTGIPQRYACPPGEDFMAVITNIDKN